MQNETKALSQDQKFILSRIKIWEKRNAISGRPVTYRDIWQGCYDVWGCDQDRIDAIEIPKTQTEKAEALGLIQQEIVEWRGVKGIKWSITKLGQKLLDESGGAYWE